VTDGRL